MYKPYGLAKTLCTYIIWTQNNSSNHQAIMIPNQHNITESQLMLGKYLTRNPMEVSTSSPCIINTEPHVNAQHINDYAKIGQCYTICMNATPCNQTHLMKRIFLFAISRCRITSPEHPQSHSSGLKPGSYTHNANYWENNSPAHTWRNHTIFISHKIVLVCACVTSNHFGS